MFEFLSQTGIVISVVLILLTFIYLLLLFIFLIRIFERIRLKKKKDFIRRWEYKIFEYINEGYNPQELIKLFPKSSYKYLLHHLRSFQLTLKSEDKERIQKFVSEIPLYDYLVKNLKSLFIKKLIFGAYYLGLAESKNAKFIIRKKLKTYNELAYITCALALARMNDVDSINSIFNEASKFKYLSKDTLQSILLEFNESACKYLSKRMEHEKSPLFKSVIIAVLRHYKFTPAAPSILKYLFNRESTPIVIESLKYFGEVKYSEAVPAIRFYLMNSKPDVRAEAIKAALKIGEPSLEERVWSLIYNHDRNVKVTAAESSYYFSDQSREKLKSLAYSIPNTMESSIARMIISQKIIHLN